MVVINIDLFIVELFYWLVCIKNCFIELVRVWQFEVMIIRVCSDIVKGDVVYVKFQIWVDYFCLQFVEIVGIVFFKYDGSLLEEQFYIIVKLQVFEELCQYVFNYYVLGYQVFDMVWCLIDKVKVFEVYYSNFDFMDEFLLDEVVGYGE